MSTQALEKLAPTDTGVCGTNGGWYRHTRAGQKPCDPCREAYNAKRRTRSTPRPPLKPCGTPAAYSRHYARGEKPCEECTQAHNELHAQIRRAKGIPERGQAANAALAEIEFLASCGEGYARIAQAVGLTPASLEKKLFNHGRQDLHRTLFTHNAGWVGN